MTLRFGNELLRKADDLARFSEDAPRVTRTYLSSEHRRAGLCAERPPEGTCPLPPEGVPAAGVPPYADARLYGEHGVPIVMSCVGARTLVEANAKRPDENLLLEDLRRATRVVAGAVRDLLAA